tara:strand:+ start:8499 stop:9113 length:615 start_codon:yes stop_codon:yes gene_type:complete
MIIYNNEGRPIYKLWLEDYDLLDITVARSTLPEELLWLAARDILSLLPKNISQNTQKRVIHRLHKRLENCLLTKYFHLPDVVLNGNQIKEFTLEVYVKELESISSPLDHVYSDFFNPLFFEAMKYQFYRYLFFRSSEFEREAVQISRRDFQLAFADHRAASQYVRFYSSNNIFYCVEEDGYTAYLMVTGFQLELILILEKNEEN